MSDIRHGDYVWWQGTKWYVQKVNADGVADISRGFTHRDVYVDSLVKLNYQELKKEVWGKDSSDYRSRMHKALDRILGS